MKHKYFYHQVSDNSDKEMNVIESVFNNDAIFSRKFLDYIAPKMLARKYNLNSNGYECVSVCVNLPEDERKKYKRDGYADMAYDSYILGEGYNFKPLSFIIDGNIAASKCEYIADGRDEYEYYLNAFPNRHFSLYADEYHIWSMIDARNIKKIGFPIGYYEEKIKATNDKRELLLLEKELVTRFFKLKNYLTENKINVEIVDVKNPEKVINK